MDKKHRVSCKLFTTDSKFCERASIVDHDLNLVSVVFRQSVNVLTLTDPLFFETPNSGQTEFDFEAKLRTISRLNLQKS